MDLTNKQARIEELSKAISEVGQQFKRDKENGIITIGEERIIGQLIDALPPDKRVNALGVFNMSRAQIDDLNRNVYLHKVTEAVPEDTKSFYVSEVRNSIVTSVTTPEEFYTRYVELRNGEINGNNRNRIAEPFYSYESSETDHQEVDSKQGLTVVPNEKRCQKEFAAALFEGMGKCPKIFPEGDLLKVLGFLEQLEASELTDEAPELKNEKNMAFLASGLPLDKQIMFLEEHPDITAISKALVLSAGLLRERKQEIALRLEELVHEFGISYLDLAARGPSLEAARENISLARAFDGNNKHGYKLVYEEDGRE